MGDEPSSFNWDGFVPQLVHPVQVAILEALTYLERPLSATDLTKLFGDSEYYLSIVSYHVGRLAELGVLEVKSRRAVRGAEEKFLYFAEGP